MVTDFPDWEAPQAHADRIAVTGAPPLVFKRVLDNGVGQSLPHGGTITRPASGKISVNQPTYEFFINIATASSPAPVASVELQWFDSALGSKLDAELYYFYTGNLAAHFVHGRGPSKGDQLVFIFTNYSGSVDATISWAVVQTSRVFTREFWHSIGQGNGTPTFPGLTSATWDISSNKLACQANALAASATSDFVLPLYTGTVRLWGTTTDPAAGNSKWRIFDNTGQIGTGLFEFKGSNGQTGFAPDGASTLWVPTIALPRSQCTLELSNTATTTQTLSTTIIAQEDRA